MTALNKRAELRKELLNPAIGSNNHLRKLALSLLDALEAAESARHEALNLAEERAEHINEIYDRERREYDNCIKNKTRLAVDLAEANRRIAELSASHSKLREGMASIYNAICENGASTSLSAILTFVKRSREESATADGIGVKGE
ncbi:MAG: hypothetical protein RR619_08380 [Raoultibacter sp.]